MIRYLPGDRLASITDARPKHLPQRNKLLRTTHLAPDPRRSILFSPPAVVVWQVIPRPGISPLHLLPMERKHAR